MQREPNLACERRAWEQGHRAIVGIDEVGRGAWAGPVVAAAVILPPPDEALLDYLAEVRDSKLLSPRQRERCATQIADVAIAVGVGSVDASRIDVLGIVPATRRAMLEAIAQLGYPCDYVLTDAVKLPLQVPQRNLIKGDRICLSIAAASIIAKVTRDRWMAVFGQGWPQFGWQRNKGYGTPEHRRALQELGPTPLHRFSFAPIRLLHEDQDA